MQSVGRHHHISHKGEGGGVGDFFLGGGVKFVEGEKGDVTNF